VQVTTGKHIKVGVGGEFRFERTAETPSRVTLTNLKTGQVIYLWAHTDSVDHFCAAYRRVCDEDIAYKTSKFEDYVPEKHVEEGAGSTFTQPDHYCSGRDSCYDKGNGK